MINEILAHAVFELKVRLRTISSYLYFALFCGLAFFLALIAGGLFPDSEMSFGLSNKVLINSSVNVTMYMVLLTVFLVFVIAGIFGQAICKDYLSNSQQLIFSTPLKVKGLLLGRFLGAFVFSNLIYLGIPLGIYLGTFFAPDSLVGEHHLSAYLMPMFKIALPTTFVYGSFFFLAGSKTKKMTPIYVVATLLFLFFMLSGTLLKNLDSETLGAILDPTSVRPVMNTFKYWTVEQQNNNHLLFEGLFLWNRLLWMGLAVISMLVAIFSFSKLPKRGKAKSSETIVPGMPTTHVSKNSFPEIDFSELKWTSALFRQVKFEFQQSVGNLYFKVLSLAAVGYVFVSSSQIGRIIGTNTHPVTYNVLEMIGGVFSILILIIITLYSGEAVWRDRDSKISQIVDALPTPNFVFFIAKYINLILITIVLLTMMMVTGIIIQSANGYLNFELGQYFTELYLIKLPAYLNLISLVFFIQVISRNKYLGHALVIVYYLFSAFGENIGFTHQLYRFNSAVFPEYSDLNGYGHGFKIFHFFNSYWLFFSVVLLVLAYVFWHRGTLLPSYRSSLQILKMKMSRPLWIVALISFTGFGCLGSYLFYQTNIVNPYITGGQRESTKLQYELKYKKFEEVVQIELQSVRTNVDIFPKEMRAKISAKLGYYNQTNQPLSKIFLNYPKGKWEISFSAPVEVKRDDALKVAIYELKKPLMPGESLSADYVIETDQSSIKNGDNERDINYNGTFLSNAKLFPHLGYSNGLELSDNTTREKYGLNPKRRSASIHDEHEHQYNAIGVSWVDFEAIVSTSDDQIAIAPGALERQWKEKGRNYFHYKMDQKILNFFSFFSGRYQVRRDTWNDVAIEIYYHKGHEYNLDRIVASTKRSLDYFSKEFGPYQHTQYRVIEVPRTFGTFAQAFPNTIAFSEEIGFIAKIDDRSSSDIDYAFYANAHELAHQWWAYQLVGAHVEGSVMLAESFAQYSSLMVMEKEYGKKKMRRFLKFELDKYLKGRAQEDEYESPLYLADTQDYIYYRKGSLVFYALKDYFGEDLVNSAMRETLQRYGRKGPDGKLREGPYMTTLDFLNILKSKVPADSVFLIEDMFEKIVLFKLRAKEASGRILANGKYEVTLEISSQKLYADEKGKEAEHDFQQEIDIGILDKDGEFLYLQKHLISNGDKEIKVIVSGVPAEAGIDPLNILIDRNSGDNVKKLKIVADTETQP